METVTIKNGNKKSKKNRSNGNKTDTKIQVSVGSAKPKSKSSKKKNLLRTLRGDVRSMGLREAFTERLLYPDVHGPFRIPRVSSAARTGLAMDRTRVIVTGSATNIVQLVQAETVFTPNTGAIFATTTIGANLGAAVGITPGTQFPSSTQMADVNITSTSMSVTYIGSPLNVKGELILGQCIPILGTSSYNAMYYYPGTIHIPIASCINNTLRVSGRKLSAAADEFVAVSAGNPDYDAPFIGCVNLPAGESLLIDITRTFEYRSTTVTASVVPYEKATDSHSRDQSAYQDAQADIAGLPTTLTEGVSEYAREAFLGAVGSRASSALGELVGPGAMTALSYFAQRNMQNLRGIPGFGAPQGRALF